ncbi:MAG: hypothetical protein M3295_01080 [Chloroflexota bacterium]|nr:hypothetical protein [Chloroflexota bacterium]
MTRDPSLPLSTYSATPPASTNVSAYPAAAPLVAPRDAVRWGPIWAGLLVAIGSFLLLSLLGLVIGIETVSSGAVEGSQVSQLGEYVAALLAVLSFLIGGFVTGRTSAIRGRASGLLNGFLVWALGIVLIALLSAIGLGQLFGALGNLFAQLRSLTGPVGAQDPQEIAATLRSSALIAFLSTAIPALASAVGGWLGARGGEEVEAAI